jgi:hypothetical protein
MKTIFTKLATLCLIALLYGCGGSSSSTSTTPDLQSSARFPCTGYAQQFFTQIQGQYSAKVDPRFALDAGQALSPNTQYQVRISASDCSIKLSDQNKLNYSFVYFDPSNTAPSKITGLAPTETLHNPTDFEWKNTQYNLSVSSKEMTIELERKITRPESGDLEGDLHLMSIPGANSFGALIMKKQDQKPL